MNAFTSATEIAAAVASGRTTATAVMTACLERIERLNPVLNAFTAVLADRARARAAAIDASGAPKGKLAGVPFAVKNLIDVAGLPTLGRVQDQPRPSARDERRAVDRAAGSGGRDPGRCVEHGRIRLRLHRRERA